MELEQTAVLVAGEGETRRSIALALAAEGVRVVILGEDEHAIAEIVGEIAFGGGNARHVVGNPRAPQDVQAAAERCRAVFGRLDASVGCEVEGGRAFAAHATPREVVRFLDEK